MKELKALEVLTKRKNKLEMALENLKGMYRGGYMAEKMAKDEIKELKEAIAELEALQAPKACDGCKELCGYHDCNVNVCVRYGTLRGWGDYYEPKETQKIVYETCKSADEF